VSCDVAHISSPVEDGTDASNFLVDCAVGSILRLSVELVAEEVLLGNTGKWLTLKEWKEVLNLVKSGLIGLGCFYTFDILKVEGCKMLK